MGAVRRKPVISSNCLEFESSLPGTSHYGPIKVDSVYSAHSRGHRRIKADSECYMGEPFPVSLSLFFLSASVIKGLAALVIY